MWLAATCEQRLAGGFLGEPANTLTSLAFVVVGTALLARWRGRAAPPVAYGLLVVAVGVGSAIQHGPHPAWQAYAHDLPLAAVLAYVAVDAAADLTGRRLGARWWLVPAAALVPLVAAGPAAATAGQAVLAVAAVGLNLWRVPRPPAAAANPAGGAGAARRRRAAGEPGGPYRVVPAGEPVAGARRVAPARRGGAGLARPGGRSWPRTPRRGPRRRRIRRGPATNRAPAWGTTARRAPVR